MEKTHWRRSPVCELERAQSVPGRASIICPTTDERIIFHAQLYECFAAQAWADKELVVVDTGPFASPFLAQKAREDSRVIYRHFVCPGTSLSVGFKRNLAIEAASGEVIVHFDDDDLYAPSYVERMLEAMGTADAVTLSSWLVCDSFTGRTAFVDLNDDGSQDCWVLGYGFSNVYRRQVALRHPFADSYFGEDYSFLRALRDAPGSAGVKTFKDEEGIVLHMQHGSNLSTSHAHAEVPQRLLFAMPVAQLRNFPWLMDSLVGHRSAESPYLSVGSTYRMYLRPPPRLREAEMSSALRRLGVLGPVCKADSAWEGLQQFVGAEYAVCVSFCIRRMGECFHEPGRAFGETKRFDNEALLPADVQRTLPAERVALLHVARMLLRRCPPRTSQLSSFSGWLRLHVHELSDIGSVVLLARLAQYFPAVRFEVGFDSAGPSDDSEDERRRELLTQLLAAELSRYEKT